MVAFGIPNISSSDPGIKSLIMGIIFPVGLVLVIMCGVELVTGNMMILPAALLANRNYNVLGGLLKNWFFSYWGNFAGSVFVAYFFCYLTGSYEDPRNIWRNALQAMTMTKCVNLSVQQVFKFAKCLFIY